MMATHTCKVINGRALSKIICSEIHRDVMTFYKETARQPKLVVYQVGNREDASLYINQKNKFASKCGVLLSHVNLPADCSESTLLDHVNQCNNDPHVHGIMLQLPLDSVRSINVSRVVNAVHQSKDVDGLCYANTAILSRGEAVCIHCGGIKPSYGRAHLTCTAATALHILRSINFDLTGSRCVVIGRGQLAGAPIADLLSGSGRATVTICHEYSRDLREVVSSADLLIVAAGSAGLIPGHWIRHGAVVLDYGYNVLTDPDDPTRVTTVGDVHYATALSRAGWLTPVPGGAGPLCVAMLLRNTVNSAKWSIGQEAGCCLCSSKCISELHQYS